MKYNGSDTKVEIPEGVTRIDGSAFYECRSLEKITIPKSVTSVGPSAFSGTKWWYNQSKNNDLIILDNIFIDVDGPTDADFNITATSVKIPDSVEYIGNWAFIGCSSLQEIIIPNGVTSIYTETFSGCSSLQKITLPENITGIGLNAFAGTLWLEERYQRMNLPF